MWVGLTRTVVAARARPQGPTAWGRSAKTCSQLAKETAITYQTTSYNGGAGVSRGVKWPAAEHITDEKTCGVAFCELRDDDSNAASQQFCEGVGGACVVFAFDCLGAA